MPTGMSEHIKLKDAFKFFKKEDSRLAQLAKGLRIFRKADPASDQPNSTTIRSQLANLALSLGGDTFLSDGMLLWGREIGWLRDENLARSIHLSEPKRTEDLFIAWRTHILTWAASQARSTKGDFFEFGCYEGYTASVIRRYCDDFFSESTGRKYFWFDLFESQPNDKKGKLDHSRSIEEAK